ncbi:hypothetical protein [Arthrobacter silvisoli]|uniref:hypothetical protein n=1 Tax=Arthrobacter silvisoli TaxID=2291022 RepID=UPI00109B9CF4|nr:hypothetical protein [Arthrobacter silvisoli]
MITSAPSPDEAHAEGLRQRRTLVTGVAAVILSGPFVVAFLLLLVLVNPTSVELLVKDSRAFVELTAGTLRILALDSSALGGFVAFGGLLLAVHKLDLGRSAFTDKALTFRLLAITEFRETLQFLGVLGTATAPVFGLLWIVLHAGEPGWERATISITGQCLGLWLVLILAVPDSSLGLKDARDEWGLRHMRYRATVLEHQFSGRWGRNFTNTRQRLLRPMLRLALHLGSTAVASSAFFVSLTLADETAGLSWSSAGWIFVLMSIIFGLFIPMMLSLGVGAARLALAANSRGFIGTSRILTGIAYAFPAIFATAGEWYAPFIMIIGILSVIHAACITSILVTRAPKGPFLGPFRPIVLPIQEIIFGLAQHQLKDIEEGLERRLDRFSPRRRRKMMREISKWESLNNASDWRLEERRR